MNTVRRDINELVSRGSAKKVYGGVCAVSRDLIPYDERESKNAENKKRIAKAAAALVKDGDIIFIDSGTTTHHMVSYLKDKRVTILTDINVCLDALAFPNHKRHNSGRPTVAQNELFLRLARLRFYARHTSKKALCGDRRINFDGVHEFFAGGIRN
jgi:DeoR family myo-inositol catabolism operon transcriptional repressor